MISANKETIITLPKIPTNSKKITEINSHFHNKKDQFINHQPVGELPSNLELQPDY